MARTLKLTPMESVEVRSSTPEALEVEATYGPASKPPPKHMHPAQDEHFEVLAGSLRAVVGEEERVLGPGETLEIPRGTPHRMWNPGGEPARVRWQTRPRGRTEQWFTALDTLQRQGRVGGNGLAGPFALAALLSEYRDVVRLAVGPGPAVRCALAALGAVGRARGYDPVALGAGE